MPHGNITYAWREPFTNCEVHARHSAAFEMQLFHESEWDRVEQTKRHRLGWVVTRDCGRFGGFINDLWDGLVHAFIEDVMVDTEHRHRRVGVGAVHAARDGATAAGCAFLHVGFDADLRTIFIDAGGFEPTLGGLLELT